MTERPSLASTPETSPLTAPFTPEKQEKRLRRIEELKAEMSTLRTRASYLKSQMEDLAPLLDHRRKLRLEAFLAGYSKHPDSPQSADQIGKHILQLEQVKRAEEDMDSLRKELGQKLEELGVKEQEYSLEAGLAVTYGKPPSPGSTLG